MERPIVFLDFDGVLRPLGGPAEWSAHAFGALNWLLRESNAGVVVTSMWRYDHSDAGLLQILRSHGFDGEMVGSTPAPLAAAGVIVAAQPRGVEIANWLDEHGERAFVVIDDESVEPFSARLVRVPPMLGFQREHAEMALEILRRSVSS